MYVKDISNGLKMVYRDVFMDAEIELIGKSLSIIITKWELFQINDPVKFHWVNFAPLI